MTSVPETLGTRTERRQLLRDTLAAVERLFPEESRHPKMQTQMLELHFQLGDLIVQTSSKGEALAEYHKCRAVAERLLQTDPSNEDHRYQLARGHLATGVALMDMGRTSEALDAYRRACGMMDSLVGPVPHRNLRWNDTLALGYHNTATATPDPAEALRCYDRAITFQRHNVARNPHYAEFLGTLAQSYNNRGWLLERLGLRDEALASYEEGRALRKQMAAMATGDRRYDTINALADSELNIGRLYRRTDPTKAAEHYDAALGYCRQLAFITEIIQFKHDRAKCYLEMGSLERQRGNATAARANLHEAERLLEELAASPAAADLAEVSVDLARAHYQLGLLERDAGRAREAAQEFQRAVDFVERLEGRLQRKVNLVERALALAYLGRFESASAAADAVAKARPWVRSSLSDLARVFAVSVEPARRAGRATLADDYTRCGLQLLRRAQAAGSFQSRPEIDWLKHHPDLEPLRATADFRALLEDLEQMLAAMPVIRLSTLGVMAAPFGQGCLPAASAVFPGRARLAPGFSPHAPGSGEPTP